MKTVAVIPCHNEAKHIADVVTEAQKHVDIVLVSDDWSTDKTREIAFATGASVIVPKSVNSHGCGVTVMRGINYAIDRYNADIIVLLDGDGQHNPNEIPRLLYPILFRQIDVVMGSRFQNGQMPRYRRFGNKLLSYICNVGAFYKPSDTMTGYWAIATRAIPELTERKWGMAVELLIKCRANGRRMVEVPVQAIYHNNYSDNSTVCPVRLGLALLWYIIKWRLKVEVKK